MASSSLVSVIIPCFNCETTINDSIESVYSQNYPYVELVVVDDGSTDKSREIILSWKEKFIGKGWHFTYLYQDNGGPGSAISLGLKHIHGDYLTLLDADDRFLDSSIKTRAVFLDEHPDNAGVRTNGWIVSAKMKKSFVTNPSEKQLNSIFEALLLGKTNNWSGSYMIRTSILFSFYQDKEFYPSRYGQNLQLLLPVSFNRIISFIDTPLMEYIKREDSVTNTSDADNQLDRDISNMTGYYDIRCHMLNEIVEDTEYYLFLKTQLDLDYHKQLFNIALWHRSRKHLIEYYQLLKDDSQNDISIAISYYNVIFKPISILLRVYQRIILFGKNQ